MVVEKKAVESKFLQEKLSAFLANIWLETERISLYILAFIHRSIVNERASYTPEHNERLEFLGDAVLELCITELLYLEFPDKPEWELTDIRSALVRWRNLALIASKLQLWEYLLLGKWEEKWWGRNNDYILANTLEALIWAIYLDKWYAVAHDFVVQYIFPSLHDILEQKLFKDFKTLFQESAQAHFDITPCYKVHSESWPDHDKVFEVGVYLGEKLYGTGKGSSKKKAQEDAAKNAYSLTFNTL